MSLAVCRWLYRHFDESETKYGNFIYWTIFSCETSLAIYNGRYNHTAVRLIIDHTGNHNGPKNELDSNTYYTEHCSVGPTKLIETTTIASMRMKNDEDFYG